MRLSLRLRLRVCWFLSEIVCSLKIPFLLLLFGIIRKSSWDRFAKLSPKSKQKGLALNKFIYPLRSKKRNFKNSRKCSDRGQVKLLWGISIYLSNLLFYYNSQIYFCCYSLTFSWWKVSKNQGSFQGIFYFIAFRKTAGKYFPSRSFPLKKRNAITEKFTANSVERPF